MERGSLNVVYNGMFTQIRMIEIDDVSDLQDAIKLKFGPMKNIGAPQIKLFDRRNVAVLDLEDLREEYFSQRKETRWFVSVILGSDCFTVELASQTNGYEQQFADRLWKLLPLEETVGSSKSLKYLAVSCPNQGLLETITPKSIPNNLNQHGKAQKEHTVICTWETIDRLKSNDVIGISGLTFRSESKVQKENTTLI